jgi:hypothetical protein
MSQSQHFHTQHERLFPRPFRAVPTVAVSERLALSLRALGASGEAWLAGLPALLASLAADWSVTVGAGLDGGSTSYVAEAVTHEGIPVVLKVSIPPGIDEFTPFERQVAALRLAGGDPYVGLIRHDLPRQALLLERLGQPMAKLGWPAVRQLAVLARTAARGCARSRTTAGCPPGRKRPAGTRASSLRPGRTSPGRARRQPWTWPFAVPPTGRPHSIRAGKCSYTETCMPPTPCRCRNRPQEAPGSHIGRPPHRTRRSR